MAQRPTRKAGIPQTRLQDPKLQRTFDAIIERVEVIDGLRGDPLDKAVTYRDLGLSGFVITGIGAGGGPQIVGVPPGSGGGEDNVGPAAAPTNLVAAETFLALLLTWVNSSVNLQHVEVWRSLTDDLSAAQMIGTTVSPQYLDYVGELKTFYYWVRSLGTDGTYSAFNDTAGTVGTTGIDPSGFEIELNISAANLDAALAARIDLIDVDAVQDSLMTRVAAAEGDIVAVDARTTSLESTATGLATSISGNTTAINANATAIATQQTSITTLLADLGIAESDVASNAASIAVNASDILNLTAAIGALDASGGQEWEFLTTVEGFIAGNASLTHDGAGTGSIIFTPSGADPYLLSPTIGIAGGIFTQVVARVRQTIGGGTWEGTVTYTTGGHTASSSFSKTIPDPSLALSEWVTLTWDMSDLTSGGADWVNSTITSIRLDLVSDAAGKFEVDWIIIAKFSTTALTEAISALDARVTVNESGISTQGTDLTVLTSRIDDPTTGLDANAAALTALTTDVTTNAAGIAANVAAITALETQVYDPVVGAVATSSAFTQLQSDVSANSGVLTAQASDLTQLLARIEGGYASMTNPLTTLNENYGTSYTTAEIQSFADVDGRTGVAARITTSANVEDFVFRADGERIVVGPNDIVEVRFSVFHNRPTLAGSFYAGLYAFESAVSSSQTLVTQILDGAAVGTNSSPYALHYKNADRASEWLDVSYYILGSNVDVTKCPQARINGSLDRSALTTWYDGFKILTAPYVELRFLNFNGSPTYGDGTNTTTYVTDLQVRRINSEADSYAALEVQASVTASSVSDLNALYSVKVELHGPDGHPYISGFGLSADVIGGTASSAFGILADQFFITYPASNEIEDDETRPFTVGLVDGVSTVGIQGQLIVDGTIRGTSLVAKTVSAGKINVTTLDAVNANMGVLVAGTITTKGIIDPATPYYDPPTNLIPKYIPDIAANRVEIQDTAGGNVWPIWFGQGAKSAGNGRFYVDTSGNVVVKGLLDAGMIAQTFFAPAGGNQSFRVACDYPANYSGGVYSGRAAHLSPVLYVNDQPNVVVQGAPFVGFPIGGYNSAPTTFIGPTNTAVTTQYGRLGSNSEMITLSIAVSAIPGQFNTVSGILGHLMYLYHSTPTPDRNWLTNPNLSTAFTFTTSIAGRWPVTISHTQTVITKEANYNYVSFWLMLYPADASSTNLMTITNASLSAFTPNFGTADITAADVVTTLAIEDLPLWPRLPG